MMCEAVAEIAAATGAPLDVALTISIPGGEILAEKTMNGAARDRRRFVDPRHHRHGRALQLRGLDPFDPSRHRRRPRGRTCPCRRRHRLDLGTDGAGSSMACPRWRCSTWAISPVARSNISARHPCRACRWPVASPSSPSSLKASSTCIRRARGWTRPSSRRFAAAHGAAPRAGRRDPGRQYGGQILANARADPVSLWPTSWRPGASVSREVAGPEVAVRCWWSTARADVAGRAAGW